MGGFTPVIDETTGKITGYTTTIGGADTVFPFTDLSGLKIRQLASYGMIAGGQTAQTKTVSVADINNYILLFGTLGEVNGDYANVILPVNEFKTGTVISLNATYYAKYTYVSDTLIKMDYLIGDSRSTRLYGISF